MRVSTTFLIVLLVCIHTILGDVNVLYAALAYANLPLSMQSMARLISDEATRNLSCFAANQIADILKNADALAILGTQRAKTETMSLAEDWDRLLWGLLETLKLETNSACRDARIEPNLCEEVVTVGEVYIRHAMCDEVRDMDWRKRVCPDQPITSRASRDTFSSRPTYRFRLSPTEASLPPPPIALLSADEESETEDNSVPDQPDLKEFDLSIFD